MASIRTRRKTNGDTTWCVLFRHGGKQRNIAFIDERSAKRFRDNVEAIGAERAMQILEVEAEARDEPTLTEWTTQHVDTLTGIEGATRERYRAYLTNDIAPTLGRLPLSAITEASIALWLNELTEDGQSGKTAANKHALVYSSLRSAVRAGKIPSNPCEHTRLPRRDVAEMVFLEPMEFEQIVSFCTDRWKPFARFLYATGARFGEATALTVADVDVRAGTIRINKAYKYTGTKEQRVAYPKTRKSVRTINIPRAIINSLDLDRHSDELLWSTQSGGRISGQLFWNNGWRPAVKKARAAGLTKQPRVHDLRHSCASIMLNAGVPITVVQAHLGHESIQTTVSVYGHIDRRAGALAADVIGQAMETARQLDGPR